VTAGTPQPRYQRPSLVEGFLCLRVADVLVRVDAQRQLSVSALDGLMRGPRSQEHQLQCRRRNVEQLLDGQGGAFLGLLQAQHTQSQASRHLDSRGEPTWLEAIFDLTRHVEGSQKVSFAKHQWMAHVCGYV
jgi:hypothetical protein